VEGVFRASCEATLRTLRGQSETLVLLLESIVSDPLVDWAAEHEGAAAKRVRTDRQTDRQSSDVACRLDRWLGRQVKADGQAVPDLLICTRVHLPVPFRRWRQLWS
jgi:hypothetical protein